MNRGDVYWLDLPDEKSRPALVLTREAAIPVLNKVIVASMTRKIRDIPTEVRLGEADGMPTECVVSLDNLRTVSRSLLREPITTLSGTKLREVCQALAIATGCE